MVIEDSIQNTSVGPTALTRATKLNPTSIKVLN